MKILANDHQHVHIRNILSSLTWQPNLAINKDKNKFLQQLTVSNDLRLQNLEKEVRLFLTSVSVRAKILRIIQCYYSLKNNFVLLTLWKHTLHFFFSLSHCFLIIMFNLDFSVLAL